MRRFSIAPLGRLLVAHRWFLATAAGGAFVFSFFVTDGTFRFNVSESFGSFYDHQAASLLQGRLDVPSEALGAEAFVVEGKYYGYFGLTPALLRVPFVLLHLGFGRLSRSLMLAYYVTCLVLAYLILIRATRTLSPQRAFPSTGATLLLTTNVALGSTLLFLASRAYTYHEAILCGAAFALAGCYCTLRYLADPARFWWLGALACGLLSTQARPSSGLFALSFTGCAALAHLVRDRKSWRETRSWKHLLIGAGCILGVLSFNAVGYLKFHTFDGAPLKYHVQYNPERLARFDGRNFHLVNLPFNFEAYLLHPTFVFQKRFPFIFSIGRDPEGFRGIRTGIAAVDQKLGIDGGPKMDLVEPMLGLPFAMPGICLLALVGTGWGWVRYREMRRPAATLWLAAIPFAGIMFMAVATSHRYTADFCPFLITAAALGLAALDAADFRGRTALAAVLAAATAAAVLITLALTWNYEVNAVWGVPLSARRRLQRFGRLFEESLSAVAHDRAWPDWRTTHKAELPPPQIVGFSCQAMLEPGDDPLSAGWVVDTEEPKSVHLWITGNNPGKSEIKAVLERPRLLSFPGARRTAGAITPGASEWEGILRSGLYTLQIAGPGMTRLALERATVAPTRAPEDAPSLMNISARGPAEDEGQPLALEFTVAGPGDEGLLIRGLGPALAKYGIKRALTRSRLQVLSGGTAVADSAAWDSTPGLADQVISAEAKVGAPPLDAASRDAAIVLHLPAGTYTVRMTGAGQPRGVAMIEIYEIPPPR